MSQENVEFAQSVFGRWNAGERRFRDEKIHPDVVLVSRILGKAVSGRAGVRRYLGPAPSQIAATAASALRARRATRTESPMSASSVRSPKALTSAIGAATEPA